VVSIVTLVLNQILLLSMAIAFAHMSAVAISIISTSVVAVPSFELHRRWVWKKKGRSRLMKEVVPYVTLAFVGLVLSTACVALAVSLSHPLVHDRVAHAAVTDGAYLFGYMVLWGFRFVLLERYVFGRPNDPR
jgi:putative flippase GtrA